MYHILRSDLWYFRETKRQHPCYTDRSRLVESNHVNLYPLILLTSKMLFDVGPNLKYIVRWDAVVDAVSAVLLAGFFSLIGVLYCIAI